MAICKLSISIGAGMLERGVSDGIGGSSFFDLTRRIGVFPSLRMLGFRAARAIRRYGRQHGRGRERSRGGGLSDEQHKEALHPMPTLAFVGAW